MGFVLLILRDAVEDVFGAKMRLTIFSRLMIAYFVIFILVMTVSAYAILELHQLNTGTRHILNFDNRILDYKEKLKDSILSQVRYGKKYMITKDVLLYDQFFSAKGEFDKYLVQMLSMADTPSKKESLNAVKKYHQHYQSLFQEEIAFVRMNRGYSKNWYEQEIGKALDGILEELNKLATYSQQDIHHRMKLLEESGTSAWKLTSVMSVIAIFLVIGTSFFITRNITKPLTLLIDKTKEISKGIFESDLNITSPPEMLELTGAFNSMCSRLKMVDKMKSDFFSTMSHELRTPLASIKEGTTLLLQGVGGAVTDKQKRLLIILSEESNRLIGLVNSLLDLSKMEAGMMTYTFEQGSLSSLIERSVMEMTPLIEAKKIILESKISGDLPILKMDPEKILQVLRNLIANAVKFTPEGGRVTVSVQRTPQGVEVLIADTGPGIPRENLTTIFEKFHQAHLKPLGQIMGTGLGLAIVKHIVTAHGGKIWAESKLGQGSTFFFLLPV